MDAPIWITALLAALMGSLHCVGMCGGLLLASSGGEGPGWGRLAVYNAGRMVGYTLLGGLLGLMGRGLEDLGLLVGLQNGASILAAVLIVAVALNLAGLLKLPAGGQRMGGVLRRALGAEGALVSAASLGLLTALLPCGLLYLGLALALGSGSVLSGALTLLAFGLGTLPSMMGVGFLFVQLGRLRSRRLGRYALGAVVGLLGLYAVGARAVPGLAPSWLHGLPGVTEAMELAPEELDEAPEPPCHHSE